MPLNKETNQFEDGQRWKFGRNVVRNKKQQRKNKKKKNQDEDKKSAKDKKPHLKNDSQ